MIKKWKKLISSVMNKILMKIRVITKQHSNQRDVLTIRTHLPGIYPSRLVVVVELEHHVALRGGVALHHFAELGIVQESRFVPVKGKA